MSTTARFFHHIRSNAIGYICLFWLTTGTAAAATQLAAHSVGTTQLRTHAVTNAKLANSAVTAAKVKAGSLLAKDFKPGQIPAGAPGATGTQGAQGPQGPRGLQGAQGPAGPTVTASAHSFNFALTVGDKPTFVVDLDKPLVMPFAGTVYINGSVDLIQTSTTKPTEADCDLAIGPDRAHLTEIERPFFADLPKVTADDSGFGMLVNVTVPLVRSIDMPAGSYDIGIRCQNVSATGAPEAYLAAFNVLATPTN
jgi:hypothetical protein